ncbi:MAG TPA: MarR family transcriptional regulator [Ilumatobacteraceae bacterium]|nr:MarR family transcriptional regulator [Ilumatobacteraceae bacterium]
MPRGRHENAERLLLQFARFGTAVSKSLVEATKQPDFVTNAPILVLCLLDLDGATRPGAIAEVVGLTSGGTTKLLDRMEAAGLVHRSYGAIDSDHRGVQVALTARGRTLLRQATEALLAHLPEATATVKEIAALMDELEVDPLLE